MSRSTDDELDAAIALTTDDAGRDVVAHVESQVSKLADDKQVTMPAGVVRVVIDVLRVADLRGARFAIELVEARRVAATTEVSSHFNPQACDNCHFSAVISAGHGEIDPDAPGSKRVNVCRRSPPTARIVGTGENETVTSVFPPLHPDNWCGMWELMKSRRASA